MTIILECIVIALVFYVLRSIFEDSFGWGWGWACGATAMALSQFVHGALV